MNTLKVTCISNKNLEDFKSVSRYSAMHLSMRDDSGVISSH